MPTATPGLDRRRCNPPFISNYTQEGGSCRSSRRSCAPTSSSKPFSCHPSPQSHSKSHFGLCLRGNGKCTTRLLIRRCVSNQNSLFRSTPMSSSTDSPTNSPTSSPTSRSTSSPTSSCASLCTNSCTSSCTSSCMSSCTSSSSTGSPMNDDSTSGTTSGTTSSLTSSPTSGRKSGPTSSSNSSRTSSPTSSPTSSSTSGPMSQGSQVRALSDSYCYSCSAMARRATNANSVAEYEVVQASFKSGSCYCAQSSAA
ncbi:hypothetical protein ANO11243_053880 [Dothideomycetidae sp. 11243]|nr:hypothetical protein ANO11243_053880 [fungal sp. No.11243]